MSFVSLEFVVLFCTVVPAFYLLPHPRRWILLLAASYIFYMTWRPEYVLLILFTTIADYLLARRIESSPRGRGIYLSVSIVFNLSVLFWFKYYNFFNQILSSVLGALDIPYAPRPLAVLLPVGISFYTFQEIAYVIDVYRGSIRAEQRLGIFALFVAFFPQLVAGPIERAGNMLSQFTRKVEFSYPDVVAGLRQILWGAFKKIVVADRLAAYVNEVFGNCRDYTGLSLIIATLYFAFQIYCDFSGYSDIAIGTARVLGIRLMQNFRQPYFSLSIREFWQRWHISLSTWFRDYVYFPLAARTNPSATLRKHLNLIIVFLLSGLWHGASWTFVVWGGLQGLWLCGEYALKSRIRWAQPSVEWSPFTWSPQYFACAVRAAVTFCFLCATWIFFRADNMGDATYILSHLFAFPDGPWAVTKPFGFNANEFWLAAAGILVVLLVDGVDARWGWNHMLNRCPTIVRWGAYYGATASILLVGAWGTQEFIYFTF